MTTKEKKAPKEKRIILTITGICLAIILLLFIIAGITYYSFMNRHYYTSENARGLATFSQYEELEREEADFTSNEGNLLQGYFYSRKDTVCDRGVIIVNNGFGAGHEAMLSEIDALTEAGYLVYGFDKTGYDGSEGSGVGSVTQGVRDLEYAINFVSTSSQAERMEIILYGKSWGAFCSLAVLNYTDKVSAVVSMSAFNETSDMMRGEATRRMGTVVGTIISPFCYFFDYINEEQMTALAGMQNTNARILIMHSSDDTTVDVTQSYDVFLSECGEDGGRIEYVLFSDKNHSIMASEECIQYNDQMDADLQVFAEENGGEMTEPLWDEFLSRYDLKKCSTPDEEVLGVIFEFLQQ